MKISFIISNSFPDCLHYKLQSHLNVVLDFWENIKFYKRWPITLYSQRLKNMPRLLEKRFLATSRIPTRLLRWWKARLLPRSDLTSIMSLIRSNAFLSWDSMEVLEELDRLLSSDGLREDGHRSQSSISWLSYRISKTMPELNNSTSRN
jgi:hypothetical protein